MAKYKNLAVAVSFDPGVSTGYVVANVTPKAFIPTHSGVIWWESRFIDLCELLEDYKPYHIIIERFALYASHARTMINSEFETVQVIGNIQAIAHYQGYDVVTDITMLPASVKSNVTVLKKHKFILERTQSSPHINDAYKLLRYWWLLNVREKP